MKKRMTLLGLTLLALALATTLTLIFGAGLWDITGNRAFQALGGWLKAPMAFFTFLGDEQFYLLMAPLVYWCINKRLGAELAVLIVASGGVNTLLKSFIKHPRPFWSAAKLQLSDATSFSTPSGHAQNSTTLFGRVATFLSPHQEQADRPNDRARGWVALLVAVVLLVALSRVYLGVHFFGDVLWGCTTGLLLLTIFTWLRPRLAPRLRVLPLGTHMLLAFGAAAVILGLTAAGLAIHIGVGPSFGALYADAWTVALSDGATFAGMALGLWISLTVEMRAVRFSVAGPLWQRAVRYVIGITVLVALWLGLKMIFPAEPLPLAIALRIVRYAVVMLWGIVGWPWLFVKVGLGTRSG